jgi:hypothetical protein
MRLIFSGRHGIHDFPSCETFESAAASAFEVLLYNGKRIIQPVPWCGDAGPLSRVQQDIDQQITALARPEPNPALFIINRPPTSFDQIKGSAIAAT